MEFMQALADNPAFFVALVGFFSLMFGSFLNVVIHRLPIMMEKDWRAQAEEMLRANANASASAPVTERFNLIVPRSACPNCKAPITALQNIPVVSYLFLGGKCAKCRAPISLRYPIVELGTAVLSIVVAVKFCSTHCAIAFEASDPPFAGPRVPPMK